MPDEVIKAMKGTLLLTGFEPFGGDDVNPSGEVAKKLDGLEIAGYTVVSKVLPVEWGTAKKALEGFIDELDPAVVLSLGLAAGRPDISVEKVAVNYTADAKDNAGKVPEERAVCSQGQDGYFATIPTEGIVKALVEAKIPARLTFSAGTYLCNYVFYAAVHHIRTTGKKALAGFIHIPATPDMVAGKAQRPSMGLSTICDAVRRALTITVEGLTNSG